VEGVLEHGKLKPTVLSAVAIDRQGLALTVGLVAEPGAKVLLRDWRGRVRNGRWLAFDEATGLSLLRIERAKQEEEPVVVPPIAERPPKLGEWVAVIGNPFGLSHSVGYGNVSGLDRQVRVGGHADSGLIQFAATIHPGDSGGLLVDPEGRMVGIVSVALGDPSAGGTTRVPGIGFAIPASRALRVAQQLEQHGQVQRGYLGIVLRSGEGPPEIEQVRPGSPAAAAGMQPGDRIVAVDGQPVRTLDDLIAAIEGKPPGTQLEIQLERAGQQLTVRPTLAERPKGSLPPAAPPEPAWRRWLPPAVLPFWGREWPPQPPPGALLGVTVQTLTPALARSLGIDPATQGVVVMTVFPGRPAAAAGLRVFDVIVAANGQAVSDPDQLRAIVQQAAPGELELEVLRGGQRLKLVAKLGQPPAGQPPQPAKPAPGLMPRIEQLEQRLKQLEERVKRLEERLGKLELQLRPSTPAPAQQQPALPPAKQAKP